MKILWISVLCSFILCPVRDLHAQKDLQRPKETLDSVLLTKLDAMKKVDQYYAGQPQGKYQGDWENWYKARDSISRLHIKVLDSILDRRGYPGFDLVGKQGSLSFWLIAQHADWNPDFQQKVLLLLKEEVDKGNANAQNYGYLVDRVRINTNRPQVYGTQLDYNEKGQAFPKNLENPKNVNKRRAELGMEVLEIYLNSVTKAHFKRNRAYLVKQGIMAPVLYEVPKDKY
ncbi:hypothetical protein FK220_011200 [Flavobacteriaceae bacterium TP-CH-4]|uniref:Uncharacterized protein n=1 Tax=Pelagihabitans pacificus TaxID=2696054 RepID=A0A967E6S2_9FLAO|nr:DUF6624 domain-containing protein [Pelagihabitans pacificus]NHF59910.1 hypothetical protein [Pelagihabitans pacificus]